MSESHTPADASPPERVLDQLRRIHEPVTVGVPPANAFHDLIRMPDGEIRHYGARGAGDEAWRIYIASRDCGLSWQEYPAPEDCPGACVRSPWSGHWLTLLTRRPSDHSSWRCPVSLLKEQGTFVCRSTDGIEGPFVNTRISDDCHNMGRQPLALRQRQRWIVPTQRRQAEATHPVVFYSDDDGDTWEQTMLESAAPHKAEWPHQGVRWQNYACEPTVAELDDGRLWMIIRTSQDNHYEAFSEDAGATWTTPTPSRFYGTITMPTLHRLADGRLLFLWCNTTPLPEVNHAAQPELTDRERQGIGEDVFTNRDAFHAAISEDDGTTWIGFREVLLNERRNDADFRSSGGNAVTLDKSVHQSQAIELPEGRVLVSVGQHPLCRKLVIFNLDWLYEAERRDDFALGMGGWSVHQYVKSLSGNFRGITGHCAHNRRPGAQLIPHPDGAPREVLQVARHPDPRLLHERQGAVWNFPAGKQGRLRMRIRLPRGSQGARICLMDRWFNPVDPVVHHFAQYVLELDRAGRINGVPALPHDEWHDLEVRWSSTESAAAEFRIGESADWTAIDLTRPGINGLSYVHIQSTAPGADPHGLLLEEIAAATDSST